MKVNKTFSTSSNFDGLFLCISPNDSSTIFFPIFNSAKLGNKQKNKLPKCHLETGNGKTSLTLWRKRKFCGKNLGEKVQ